MTWRRNHKHLKRKRQYNLIDKFLTDVVYSNGKWARNLVTNGWRPRKSILDNYKRPFFTRKAQYMSKDKGIRAWKYLYEISTEDLGSTPSTQVSQDLCVAQNQSGLNPPWFGEPRHSSSSTQIIGW